MMWMDLRAEPLVLTLPAIDPARFYHAQLIDLYTHNFGYLGQRTTGSKGGHYLIAGPDWSGQTPKGIDHAIKCETKIAYAIYRIQLFGPDASTTSRAFNLATRVQTLSEFLGAPAPAAAPRSPRPKPDLQAMSRRRRCSAT